MMVYPRWACPSQKEGDGLQAYQAFVLLQKMMQHQSDCRTAYVYIPAPIINVFIGFLAPPLLCSKLSSVVKRHHDIHIAILRNAVERMLDRLATSPHLFGTGTPI